MKSILYTFAFVAVLCSCADSYNIQGTSTVSVLDGSKLYLKVLQDKEMKSLDSCEVVHGKFRFAGLLESTQMATLFMGDKSILPLVVEKGDINIRIDDARQRVSGSQLNDVLYDFLDKHNQLDSRMGELDHRYSQMLLDGVDENTIEQTLSAEAAVIAESEDSLVTDFVVSNFDNVLGPFIFVRLSSSVPQIEHIMSKAPDAFKENPYVSEFYKHVSQAGSDDTTQAEIDDETIQDILNGNENAY